MSYATVFMGVPIWGRNRAARNPLFLAVHDLAGKTIIPFITHGGFGLGNSQAVLASYAPQARLIEGFSIQAPQERQTIERVAQWLDALKVK